MGKKGKVLITGVAGFIGSNLAERLLSEGYLVTGIDNLSYGVFEQVPDGVEFHRLDIRSKEIYPVFEGVDYVFHLAAKNCISDCQEDPVETAWTNVTGSVNVLEASKRSAVKKVIYAESSAIYEGSAVFPTPEASISPKSFYAASKLASMHFADAYRRFHSMNFTALRYFCVYGPRQDYRRTIPPVISAFIIRLLKGQAPVIYGTGEKRRDFVHVDDVNDFHLMCITNRSTDNRTFNIGSGVNYSVKEVYSTISALIGIHISPVHRPGLEGEAEVTLADISLAKDAGWRPKVHLKDGIMSSIEFIKKNVLEVHG